MVDFLGIGAQKAGTTWIFENLQRHPDVQFPGGKEIHFWDAQRHRGVQWWLGVFSATQNRLRQGEITPAYAALDRTTIAEIFRHCPSVRLFYSLRNPIHRAWSSALMALRRAEMHEHEASDQWFIDHVRSRGSRARGDYEDCLRRWWSVFPRAQMHIVLFDDFARDPRAALKGLAHHIGVDGSFFDTLPDETLRKRVFMGPEVPIRRSLLPVLHELYDRKVDSLSELTGRDLSYWTIDGE